MIQTYWLLLRVVAVRPDGTNASGNVEEIGCGKVSLKSRRIVWEVALIDPQLALLECVAPDR